MNDAVLIGAILLAGLVSGVTGLGFGLVSMPILVAFMPVNTATTIVSVLTMLVSIPNQWTVRHSTLWREIWPPMLAGLPAGMLGVYLLTRLDVSFLRIGVLVMILGGCVTTLWAPKRALITRAFPWGPIFGLLGGIFNGALGMGGPPIALYTLLRGWDKSETKGLLCAYFIVTNLWRVILLAIHGVATWEILRLGLALLIPALAAMYAGILIFRRLSTPAFRYATMLLLLGLAIKLLAA